MQRLPPSVGRGPERGNPGKKCAVLDYVAWTPREERERRRRGHPALGPRGLTPGHWSLVSAPPQLMLLTLAGIP